VVRILNHEAEIGANLAGAFPPFYSVCEAKVGGASDYPIPALF
jgi:hypothetical protein